MSKNKYSLPFDGSWYIEYGGLTSKTSHSWELLDQRYAYDFEIRDRYGLPYFDDYLKCPSYYSYKKQIIAPCEGIVVDISNSYPDTVIRAGRPIVCDQKDPRGNYIILKHDHHEYSVICHILLNSFCVSIGDIVKRGDILALTGNSGNTQSPHLHFHVQDHEKVPAKGIPISFTNVEKVNKELPLSYFSRKHLYKGETVKNRR